MLIKKIFGLFFIILLVLVIPFLIYTSVSYDDLDFKLNEKHIKTFFDELKYVSYNSTSNLKSNFVNDNKDILTYLNQLNSFWISAYLNGVTLLRIEVDPNKDKDIFSLINELISNELTKKKIAKETFNNSRLKIDCIVDRKRAFTFPNILLTYSFLPALDTMEIMCSNKKYTILPDDYIKFKLQSTDLNSRNNVYFGYNLDLIYKYLKTEFKEFNQSEITSYYRAKTISFIESYDRKSVLKLYRTNVMRYNIAYEDVFRAISLAGNWFINNINSNENNRVNYNYDCLEDKLDNQNYSYPRHAGSTYGMMKIYSLTKDSRLLDAAIKALNFILSFEKKISIPNYKDSYPILTIAPEDNVALGNVSLTLLALLEYAKTTNDKKYDGKINGLGTFLKAMQTSEGDFIPYYNLITNYRDPNTKVLNFNGQAVLALTRLYLYNKRQDILPVLKKAFEFLKYKQWDFFLGSIYRYFFFWEVQAIAEANVIFNDEYNLVAHKIVDDAMASIMDDSSAPFDDYVGAVDQSMFWLPNTSGAGIYLEGLSQYYLIAPQENKNKLKYLIKKMAEYIISQQVTLDNSYLYKNPSLAIGCIRYNAVQPNTRNDFTQHCMVGVVNSYLNGIFD